MNELITISIMAFALGMDAFSLAIGMGMLGLRYKHIFKIGITIGAFHVIMPFLGIVIGKFLTQYFGFLAIMIGGALLIILGLQMLYSALFSDEYNEKILQPQGIGLLLFALSVSVDSFSVGLSLGMIGAKTVITLLSFGFMSMTLSWLGLIIGKKVQGYIGVYGELLGGFILLGFGIKLLWPL
ncbi:MAG: manganese efflux pump MntP family protein [Anaerobacillus sp.]|uniref:manganese efflux pump MntP n=1 Tax=Anaerobacillus sp. TaxID=1872506 RepID=UPI0039188EB9